MKELSSQKNIPSVSVVVIGLNEENRLGLCLESVLSSELLPLEIIYVDGGSTDRSVEIARQYSDIRTIVLETEHPTPGMGRNVGLENCRGELVQFLDGDMILDINWLRNGVEIFRQSNEICCVCGFVKEEKERRSFLEDVMSTDWDSHPIGDVAAPGGGGLFRRDLLLEVGAYRSDLVGGEETEIGERIVQKGYKIIRLDSLMCKHKLGMNTMSEYWCRGKRGGIAYMQLLRLNPRIHTWAILKSVIYVIGSGLIVIAALLLKYPILFYLWILLFVILVIRQGMIYYRKTGDFKRSMFFGTSIYIIMVPRTFGLIKELFFPRCGGSGECHIRYDSFEDSD